VPGVGVDDDRSEVIEQTSDVDAAGRAGLGDGDRPQSRLGEQGPARIAAGEVVGDDEDARAGLCRGGRCGRAGVGHVRGAHTTKSSTKSSGREQIHTAVVIPDQPLMALIPSRPANRVTTQKYESLK
jgi:hypothetical protein